MQKINFYIYVVISILDVICLYASIFVHKPFHAIPVVIFSISFILSCIALKISYGEYNKSKQ